VYSDITFAIVSKYYRFVSLRLQARTLIIIIIMIIIIIIITPTPTPTIIPPGLVQSARA
jgi:hypothetical protein